MSARSIDGTPKPPSRNPSLGPTYSRKTESPTHSSTTGPVVGSMQLVTAQPYLNPDKSQPDDILMPCLGGIPNALQDISKSLRIVEVQRKKAHKSYKEIQQLVDNVTEASKSYSDLVEGYSGGPVPEYHERIFSYLEALNELTAHICKNWMSPNRVTQSPEFKELEEKLKELEQICTQALAECRKCQAGFLRELSGQGDSSSHHASSGPVPSDEEPLNVALSRMANSLRDTLSRNGRYGDDSSVDATSPRSPSSMPHGGSTASTEQGSVTWTTIRQDLSELKENAESILEGKGTAKSSILGKRKASDES